MPIVPIMVETNVDENDRVKFMPRYADKYSNKEAQLLEVLGTSHTPPFVSPHHMHVWLKIRFDDDFVREVCSTDCLLRLPRRES